MLEDLTVPKLLANPTEELARPLVDAAQRLEQFGVRCITGSCGFLALYQPYLAKAVQIPVCVSSLLQADLIHRMTARPVGVITASKSALTPAHLAAVGADAVPLEIEGLDDSDEFASVILRNERDDMDLALVETELLRAGQRLISRAPDIGAILLECTDLPPYANRLQLRLRRPVFDIITLVSMLATASGRQPYAGFIH